MRNTALVAADGTAYTWAHGGGADRAGAVDVVTGLTGYSIAQVACSQGATVALAVGGAVLTWGKSATGVLGQAGVYALHAPARLQAWHAGESVEREVACKAVAAGPYHCAALSAGVLRLVGVAMPV